MKLTLGHRNDPDDAFKYCALARGAIDTEGIEIAVVKGDSGELAARAEAGELPVASLSIPAYAGLHAAFQPLTSGAAVGDGIGPVIVSNRVFIEDELGAGTTIHTPGDKTTGWVVLKLYAPSCTDKVERFDRILTRVVDEEIETGLLVAEEQIVFGNFGVYKIEDLGEWWNLNTSGLPLTLDLCCVKRDLDDSTKQKVQRVIRRSIEWGMDHHDDALAYASDLGRALDAYGTKQFISGYVNAFCRELGDIGTNGLTELLRRAAEKGLVPAGAPVDFVPHVDG